MTHVRTQIRTLVRDVLADALPPSYSVYKSRKTKINHDPDVVVVDLRITNDQTGGVEVQGDERVHTASLYVRVQRSAPEEDIDDLLDADEVLVVRAFAEASWLDLLEEHPELKQVNFADADTTGRILSSAILRFDLEYRIDMHDPETIID